MQDGSNTLFMPLTEARVARLTEAKDRPARVIEQCDNAECSAIFVIQHLGALSKVAAPRVKIEKQLAEMIKIGQQMYAADSAGAFANTIAQRFSYRDFQSGLGLLYTLNIRLMDAEAFAEKAYLFDDGLWDYGFSERHWRLLTPCTEHFENAHGESFTLTTQQSRSYRTFLTEHDEHLHVQALAGTGKTHMIEKMIDSLDRYRPLVLAFTKPQLASLLSRVGHGRVEGMTFGQLASGFFDDLLAGGKYRKEARSFPSYQLSVDKIATRLHFASVDNFSASQVANLCQRAVASFCYGSDRVISAKHIPVFRNKLSSLDQEVLVTYATRLWQETVTPTSDHLQLPLRGYHRIKQLALTDEHRINPAYTHIIVDEAHDLPGPMAQFLDKCTQPVITFGDACQRLDGQLAKRGEHVRQREIYHSVRAGRQVETVINLLIDQNPAVRVHPLEGNRERDTRIVYYDKAVIPEQPTTILVNSEWGLFEWFQRLSAANADFALLPGAMSTFEKFARECIRLFHNNTPPSHGALFRYPEWLDIKADMINDPSFIQIERMLKKGYTENDFSLSLNKLNTSGNAPIKLGRVFDAKNMEIDSVMLAPDLMINGQPGDSLSVSKAFSALYVGGTRARFQLIVPGHLRDWALDQATQIDKTRPAFIRPSTPVESPLPDIE